MNSQWVLIKKMQKRYEEQIAELEAQLRNETKHSKYLPEKVCKYVNINGEVMVKMPFEQLKKYIENYHDVAVILEMFSIRCDDRRDITFSGKGMLNHVFEKHCKEIREGCAILEMSEIKYEEYVKGNNLTN